MLHSCIQTTISLWIHHPACPCTLSHPIDSQTVIEHAADFEDGLLHWEAGRTQLYALSTETFKVNAALRSNEMDGIYINLLSDPRSTLIKALGFGSTKGSLRGVVVIDKAGMVLAIKSGPWRALGDVATKAVSAEIEEFGDKWDEEFERQFQAGK